MREPQEARASLQGLAGATEHSQALHIPEKSSLSIVRRVKKSRTLRKGGKWKKGQVQLAWLIHLGVAQRP